MKKEEDVKKTTKKSGSGVNFLLHLLQHAAIVMAVILVATVLLGSYLWIEGNNGLQMYNLRDEEAGTSYTDSIIFNRLLGNSISDVIRYGVIKSQMETDGKFDAKRVVDVTAYAGRYSIMEPEYITAQYYLDDLINWSKNGFEYKDSYLTGEEADAFLSRTSIVTVLDNGYKNNNGENIYYLNSDLNRMTRVRDVSGNQFESGEYQREDVNATIMINRYRTVEGKNIENHVSSWEEYYELCQNITKAADDLAINYDEYLKYQDIFQPDQTNVVYFIRRTVGDETQVFTNMDVKSKELKTLKAELLDLCSRSVYYDPSNMSFETDTMIEESTLRYILNGFEYAYPENTQVMIGVRKDLSHVDDGFARAQEGFNKYAPYSGQYLAAAIACIALYLLLLVVLTIREGIVGKKESGEIIIRLHREDRIPTEIMAAALCVVSFGLYWLIAKAVNAIWQSVSENIMILFAGVTALAVSLLFSFFYYSLVRRIKAHNLWKDSLIRSLGIFIRNGIRYAYRHWDVVLRVGVPFGLFVLFHVFMIALGNYAGRRPTGRLLILFILFVVLTVDAVIGMLLYRSAQARQRILECIRKINEGNLEHKVKEEGMYGDNLVMARAVNSIGDSVKNAVETSMKDERLKADLITNVSHDIKTPLTSIINYVDLIKRQNVQDPKISEYIHVLDEKSQRLKQLTDDLVEASKISSGNIVLQWEKINLVELLNQTLGEFSEKFREKALHPVISTPGNNICIQADSRRIWRVMENLFNNIFKYALEGTRVYIDLELNKKKAQEVWVMLSVKNISANPLKVNPEELTERFIRGDESRTTEGSGLGLSIAKNLVEMQNGTFEIVMDGDLFKVNLSFPLLETDSKA